MLYTQGFQTAERLANKVVPLFRLCEEQLSPQSHYDFGLRALKPVLLSAGKLLRRLKDTDALSDVLIEQAELSVILQAIDRTIKPKLVQQDLPVFSGLLTDVFSSGDHLEDLEGGFTRDDVAEVCRSMHLTSTESFFEVRPSFPRFLCSSSLTKQKVVQLNSVLLNVHGVMLVGQAATGKTAVLNVLASVLKARGKDVSISTINPKAVLLRLVCFVENDVDIS